MSNIKNGFIIKVNSITIRIKFFICNSSWLLPSAVKLEKFRLNCKEECSKANVLCTRKNCKKWVIIMQGCK